MLLLGDRIDEWVMGQITEFEGKRFKDVTRGELELGGLADQADRARVDAERKESKGLLKRIKDALGDRVLEVRVSERLRDSPAVLVRSEGDLSAQMRRMLEAAGQTPPAAQAGARAQCDASARASPRSAQGVPRSCRSSRCCCTTRRALTEDGEVGNPADFSRRLNALLVRLVTPPSDRSV